MTLPRLIVITDWSLPCIEQKLEALAPLGSQIAIQHRAPSMPTRELVARARWLAQLPMPLFINGRVEIALLLGAHLHLPEDAPSVLQCRTLVKDRLISVAVHDGTDPARAIDADFAIVAPVFAPGSKPDDPRSPLRPEGFARISASLPCPAFALGGISPSTIGEIPTAAGVCAVSCILQAADPLAVARQLLAAIRAAP